jgi:hypothetical protein
MSASKPREDTGQYGDCTTSKITRNGVAPCVRSGRYDDMEIERQVELSDLFGAALAARRTTVNWIEDGPGSWTAAGLGKEAFIVVADGEFEARVYHHPTGPEGPDPELARGPQRFPTAGGALDYCEAELGATDPTAGTPAEPRR